MKDVTPVLTESVKNKLDSLVDKYYEAHSAYQAAETANDLYNSMLKDMLKDNELSKYQSSSGLKVSMTTTHKPKFSENEMIPFLKKFNIDGLIKTKEYVDMEVLEDAIYHGQIESSALAPFKTDKVVVSLRITKPKILNE